jgi:hypothetical protein
LATKAPKDLILETTRAHKSPDQTKTPPFETDDLRKNLAAFLQTKFRDVATGMELKIGNYRWGVYAFFDYDGEPIYVGQTNERVGTRIRRHLTNQRTDAVAMSVLDPFEVLTIKVWPLAQHQDITSKKAGFKQAKAQLNALERAVYDQSIVQSKFRAVLNEKDPGSNGVIAIPEACEARLVSDQVYTLRSHPDFRISRRALVISRLAQVISEREVKGGLRRVLLVQAKRLQWLAERRFEGLGGTSSVPVKRDDEEEGQDESEQDEEVAET